MIEQGRVNSPQTQGGFMLRAKHTNRHSPCFCEDAVSLGVVRPRIGEGESNIIARRESACSGPKASRDALSVSRANCLTSVRLQRDADA